MSYLLLIGFSARQTKRPHMVKVLWNDLWPHRLGYARDWPLLITAKANQLMDYLEVTHTPRLSATYWWLLFGSSQNFGIFPASPFIKCSGVSPSFLNLVGSKVLKKDHSKAWMVAVWVRDNIFYHPGYHTVLPFLWVLSYFPPYESLWQLVPLFFFLIQ